MQKIDWYSHYQTKVPNRNFEKTDLVRFYKQNQILIDCVLSFKPRTIIEAGAGLARDSFVLASKGINTTLFDIDERFLDLGEENAKRMGLSENVTIQKGNLFTLSKVVPHDKYEISFSGGVLEHFEDNEIANILSEQLLVAPIVIFTVPLESAFNDLYFDDTIYRRLLSEKQWSEILKPFKIKEQKTYKSRHDDLLVVLGRKE